VTPQRASKPAAKKSKRRTATAQDTGAASPAYDLVEINAWADFQALLAGPNYRNWAFRGQADASWPLFSSLSRYVQQFGIHPDAWPEQEERSLRIFRRKAHLFLHSAPPPDDDAFQWLALMQHFGAPTRLLDFTWSPFVAGFFALERATRDAAVWGLSIPRIIDTSHRVPGSKRPVRERELGMRTTGNYERFFLQNAMAFVTYGEPNVMNQRLVAQSGTFVVPGVLAQSVDQIISGYPDPKRTLTKFVLKTAALREEAMSSFYSMNITNSTLFPGLDGLAKSLAYELEFHWAYNPRTMQYYPGYSRSDL
jgi:FRG domain-containing protein